MEALSHFIQKYVAQSCLDLNDREGFGCRGSTRFMGFVVVLRPLLDRLFRALPHLSSMFSLRCVKITLFCSLISLYFKLYCFYSPQSP